MEFLVDKRLLLVFDNAEDPIQEDKEGIVGFFDELMQRTHCKVLLTSRVPLVYIGDIKEEPLNLGRLRDFYTMKLLKSKSPRPIETDEERELRAATPDRAI